MLLRKELSVAAIALFLAVFANAQRVKRMYALCPPDFIRIGSECYFISKERVNWLDAHFECKDRNSRLAEPIKHEDKTLRKYLVHSEEPERFDIWIGGIYNWERKKWQWGYNGRDVAYQSFSQMAPGSSQDLKFHCAVLNPQLKYRWSARSCVDKHHYICQHRMPYVTEKKKLEIYSKWNQTYPNQMANEVEVVLSEQERLRKDQRQQTLRLQRERQRNLNNNRNRNRQGENGTNDRETNTVDWQQQNQNNKRRQRPRDPRKRISNNILTEVDNNIGDLNNNQVKDNDFSPDSGYGMRPSRRNRTRNGLNTRNEFGQPRRQRKHKKPFTATTTTTTTTTTFKPEVTHPTLPAQTPKYLYREPTSAEERYRIENEQVRRQEEVRRREQEEEARQREQNKEREKNRQEVEMRRLQIEEREQIARKEEQRREERRHQESLRRQEEERKRLQLNEEQQKREYDFKERNSNSVEPQPEEESVPQPQQREEGEESRKPIEDPRVESLRKSEEEKRRRRNQLRERLQQLSPEQLKEFYAKRAERNKRRGAAKRENVPTETPEQ